MRTVARGVLGQDQPRLRAANPRYAGGGRRGARSRGPIPAGLARDYGQFELSAALHEALLGTGARHAVRRLSASAIRLQRADGTPPIRLVRLLKGVTVLLAAVPAAATGAAVPAPTAVFSPTASGVPISTAASTAAPIAAPAAISPLAPAAPAPTPATPVPTPAAPQLPYDTEYPTIPYASGEANDPVAVLARGLESGDVTLAREGQSAYLAAVLRELGIPASSQMLVFSKTSLLARLVWPETPRAIYFNDRVYVAWTPGSDGLEISAHDPELGPVFYNLEPDAESGPRIRRQTGLCLQCHDSFSLTGGGVPRHILGSGPTDENGQLASHELWRITADTTPIRERWGGWYVTGTHGDQLHMGNVVAGGPDGWRLAGRRGPGAGGAGLGAGDAAAAARRGGNLTDLGELIDVTPYLGAHSDIVALLVAEHQVTVQNLITLVGYRVRTRLHIDEQAGLSPGEMSPRTARLVEGLGESLVRALFLVGSPRFESPIEGTSTFVADFMAGGRRDALGRSLRDLDLRTRLFRHPLSYLVHSPEYDALPARARAYVDGRILGILRGEEGGRDFAHLSAGDREAILSILRDTKPEIVGRPR